MIVLIGIFYRVTGIVVHLEALQLLKENNVIRKLTLAALLATLVPLTFASISAEAAPVLVTSRVALGGTDFVNWADLGPNRTEVPNSFTITSDDGFGVDVSKASAGNFIRLEQRSSWSGNFAPGAPLLSTLSTPGPISLDFGGLVFGGGAQIQWGTTLPFTATIEAFDATDMSLGIFTLAGDSTPANNNSAIFIGILDSVQSIARIEIGLTTNLGTVAINQFDIVGAPDQPTQVSEPGTLALLGAGLVGLGVLRRRKAA